MTGWDQAPRGSTGRISFEQLSFWHAALHLMPEASTEMRLKHQLLLRDIARCHGLCGPGLLRCQLRRLMNAVAAIPQKRLKRDGHGIVRVLQKLAAALLRLMPRFRLRQKGRPSLYYLYRASSGYVDRWWLQATSNPQRWHSSL
jgi:hypothetical protein